MLSRINKTVVITVVCLVIAYGAYFINDYFALGIFSSPVSYERMVLDEKTGELGPSFSDEALPGSTAELLEKVEYKTEIFAEDLVVPWSIVFTSPEKLLVTERDGRLRVIQNGTLSQTPYHTFTEVAAKDEAGLMGSTLDPAYPENGYIYFCLTYEKSGKTINKIDRYKDTGTGLTEPVTILDDMPSARYHAGCRIKIGTDNKLYITTGDATEKSLAQEADSLAGKILRVNLDGTVPKDNPFPGSPVYSLGHRNPQGIDFHPISGLLYATEHGPSIIDGPAGGDEINLIIPGQNYGWPLVSHENSRPGLTDPLIVYTPAVAPAGATFYSGAVFPQFKNNYFFGLLKGEGIIRMVFSEQDPKQIILTEKLSGIDVGRVRDITEGPDGYIYVVTDLADGALYRIEPAN